MNYKLLIRIFNLFKYLSWIGLFLSMFVDDYMFFRIGIILAAICCPICINSLKELQFYEEKKRIISEIE